MSSVKACDSGKVLEGPDSLPICPTPRQVKEDSKQPQSVTSEDREGSYSAGAEERCDFPGVLGEPPGTTIPESSGLSSRHEDALDSTINRLWPKTSLGTQNG